MQQAEWWRGAALYQIYPRSFQDSNGDGVGDLAGVLQRLEYVAELGVDGIWLSPFFPSPMLDFGYDVSDYRGVDPVFGTLADFDAVLARAHSLGLKVIIDQVWSHTASDASVVHREPGEPRQPAGRLVRLGRRQAGWQSAQQLAELDGWFGVALGAASSPVPSAQLPAADAGPELSLPGRAGRDPRRWRASGSTEAWTASVSTPPTSTSTTEPCAPIPHCPRGKPATRRC